jgi:hypothetical protein
LHNLLIFRHQSPEWPPCVAPAEKFTALVESSLEKLETEGRWRRRLFSPMIDEADAWLEPSIQVPVFGGFKTAGVRAGDSGRTG